MINTMGIAARICLSQVIRILTSCLEKKTRNKSLGDKIWLGEWRCTRMTQPCWGSPKQLFLPVFLGLKPASMETSHLVPVLLSPHSWEKAFPRQLQVEGAHFLQGDSTRTKPGKFGMGSSSLRSPDGSPALPHPHLEHSEGSGSRAVRAGAHPSAPEGHLRWDGTFGIHSRNSPASLAFLADTGAGVGAGVRSPRAVRSPRNVSPDPSPASPALGVRELLFQGAKGNILPIFFPLNVLTHGWFQSGTSVTRGAVPGISWDSSRPLTLPSPSRDDGSLNPAQSWAELQVRSFCSVSTSPQLHPWKSELLPAQPSSLPWEGSTAGAEFLIFLIYFLYQVIFHLRALAP